jgi:prepilin-type N-terminal cleavage/methylation domain-containing protein
MHPMIERVQRRSRDDCGFTLPELVITVAIIGIIATALTGVVISYLKSSVDTQARLTESHDVQFAAAYWQRDVASVGVRSSTYNEDPTLHTFPLEQSVASSGALAECNYNNEVPSGDPIVTLAWSEYHGLNSSQTPKKVTVTYLTQPDGKVHKLFRVRCTGATVDSTVEVAHNLREVPKVECTDAAGNSGCGGAGANVPTIVVLPLRIRDPEGHGSADYTARLIGERRQT